MTLFVSLFVWGTVVIVFAVGQASGFRVLTLLGFPLEDAYEGGLLAIGVSHSSDRFFGVRAFDLGWLGCVLHGDRSSYWPSSLDEVAGFGPVNGFGWSLQGPFLL